jgi:hypothetical protein
VTQIPAARIFACLGILDEKFQLLIPTCAIPGRQLRLGCFKVCASHSTNNVSRRRYKWLGGRSGYQTTLEKQSKARFWKIGCLCKPHGDLTHSRRRLVPRECRCSKHHITRYSTVHALPVGPCDTGHGTISQPNRWVCLLPRAGVRATQLGKFETGGRVEPLRSRT